MRDARNVLVLILGFWRGARALAEVLAAAPSSPPALFLLVLKNVLRIRLGATRVVAVEAFAFALASSTGAAGRRTDTFERLDRVAAFLLLGTTSFRTGTRSIARRRRDVGRKRCRTLLCELGESRDCERSGSRLDGAGS